MKIIHLKPVIQYYTVVGDDKKYTDCPATLVHHYIRDNGVESFTIRVREYNEDYDHQLTKQPSGLYSGTAVKLPNNEVFPDSTLHLKITKNNDKYSFLGKFTDGDLSGDWFMEAKVAKEFDTDI